MITILQNGSGIKFTFDSNDHYLQDGEIEVPVNSLSLIMDDSEMFTFVKAQSNDIFLSAKYNDVNGGMTREQLEAFFKNNMVASNLGSSISEIYVGTSADTVDANTGVVTKYDGDKQWLNIVYQDQQGYYSMTKINLNEFIIEGETGSGVTTNADGVIIGQVDPRSEEVYTAYDISGNPSTSASVLSVNESGFTVDNIQAAIDGKTLIDRRLYTPKEGVYDNTTQRITFKSDLNDSLFEVQLSADTITIDPTLDSGSTNAVANSAITNAINDLISNKFDGITLEGYDNYQRIIMCANNFQTSSYISLPKINGKNLASPLFDVDSLSLVETSAVTSSITSASTDSEVPSAKAVFDVVDEIESVASAALNDLNVRIIDVESAVSSAITSGEVQTMIDESVSGKQDTLVSGTNIKTINNESILGSGNIDIQGGGKAVSGGTNISITTGETADTINCTLPIYTAVDNTSLHFGVSNTINSEIAYAFGNGNIVGSNRYNGSYSMAVGLANTTNSEENFVVGYQNTLYNICEFGAGRFNASSVESATFGDSGNTLFSVGNGTDANARHNAFEIRQNGDIYITKDGQDVKLQDNLGGGEVSSAITSGDTNAVAGGAVYDKFDEVEQVTAAALNTLEDKFSSLDATIGNINTILESI